MTKNYVVQIRTGVHWFNGKYTHQVHSIKINKIICISNEPGCDVVAHALNMVDELHAKIN